MNLNTVIKPKSLMQTLIDAQEHGFTDIRVPRIGVTKSLSDFAAELLENAVDYQEYARYGDLIVRLSDAWKEDAEIYVLS